MNRELRPGRALVGRYDAQVLMLVLLLRCSVLRAVVRPTRVALSAVPCRAVPCRAVPSQAASGAELRRRPQVSPRVSVIIILTTAVVVRFAGSRR